MKAPVTLATDTLKAFEKVPDLYLILSPELVILTASDAYLKATLTQRDKITGKLIFDIFPDNPDTPEAHAVVNLKTSLQKVLASKSPHQMALQRYDVPGPQYNGGGFVKKYWLPVNIPVLDEAGEISYIIHKVEDATTQQNLLEEHRFLKDAQAIGHVGSYKWDTATDSIYWSDEMYRIHGLVPKSEKITPERTFSFIHPDDLEIVKEKIWGCRLKAQSIEFEHRLLRADGQTNVVVCKLQSFVNFKGEVTHLLGTLQDITQRKQAEETVMQMLNGSIAAITIVGSVRDNTGRIVDFVYKGINKAAEQILGAPAEKLTGKTFLRTNPAAKDTFFQDYVQVVETGKPVRGIYNFAQDGLEKWFDISAVKNEDGLIITWQNITAQKQAEGALKENHKLLQATLNNSPALIQVFEAIRNEAGEIVDFTWRLLNNRAKELMGNVVGKRLIEHNPGVIESGIFSKLRAVTETGEPDRFELQYAYAGIIKWYQYYFDKLENGSIITALDVTKRKKAEQELQQSKDLLQDVIDAPNIGIAVYKAVRNEKGQITDFVHEYINRASIAMLGEDFTGKLFTDHGENGRSQLPSLIEVLETGQGNSYTREADFRGKKVWFAITNTPLNKDRLVHTWQDITERKESELEILRLKDQLAQTATDKYHSIFNSIDEGFYICEVILDEASKPVDILYLEENPAAVRLTGQRYKGRRLREISTLYGEHWYQTWGEVALSGSSIRMESYSEADRLWISYFVSKLGDAASRQVAVVFQDITERKQREAEQVYLLKLSDVLRPLTDPVEIQAGAARMLGEHLGSDRAYYVEIDEAAKDFIVAHDWHKHGLPSHARRYPLNDWPMPWLINGETWVVRDTVTDPAMPDYQREAYLGNDIGAAIVVPLIKQDRLVATFVTNQRAPRYWTKTDITLVEETAERTWAALERAKAEEALRASEEKYRALFNSMDEGYCIIQMLYDEAGKAIDFRYLQVNQAFERNTDLHNAEGKTIRELAPDIEPKWMDLYDQVARTGNPMRFEEGSEALRHIYSLYAFRIGDPAEHKVAVIFSDITARKQAEEAIAAHSILLEQQVAERTHALHESKVHFEAAINVSPVVLGILKSIRNNNNEIIDLHIEWVSRSGEGLFQRDVTGKSVLKEFPYVCKVGIFEKLVKTIEEGIATDYENYYNADGVDIWAHWKAVKLEDGLFISIEDITDRKKAEQEQHKQHQVLKQAEEVARMGSWEYDLSTQSFRWSEGMFRLFNLPDDAPISLQTYVDYAVEEDKSIARRIVKYLKQGKESFDETLRIKPEGRNVITLKVKGQLLRDDQSKPKRVLGVDMDISQIIQLEEENLQMRLNQQKELLLAILEAQEEERRRIAEALHNGVGQLLYATKLHLERASKPVKQQIDAKALETTSNLLSEAIQETRRVSHDLVPVLLQDFGLPEAVKELCSKYENSSLYLTCQVEGIEQRLESHLEVAVYRISQELINNIIRHAEATRATLHLQLKDYTLLLEVCDNGKGFSYEEVGQKGIGLKTIQDRVKLLNGTITISKPRKGKGTMVLIRIPL